MKPQGLWTRDFSLVTITTILSAIGGEAMNLPVSLLVFDQTHSTFLASVILACGMLPDVFLPIIIAPLIDSGNKKRWIVILDCIISLLFLGMGFYVLGHAFSYGLYVAFTLVVATVSVCYRLAYDAWYPDLIPVGFEQKGYSVSSTIYPMVIIVMAPVATFLYQEIAIGYLFIGFSAISVVDITLEIMIKETGKRCTGCYTWKKYKSDLLEGIRYLKKEKGIRNVYTYMSITSGASSGINVMTQAFYQTQTMFTLGMLGFLKSSETLGRVIGGLLQYNKEIPVEKRYKFTKLVYSVYDLCDATLLFLPYPAMLINRFLCGLLGVQSATIREVAVKSYLPAEIRARISALFSVIFSVGGILFQIIAGWMGQIMPYRIAAMILGLTAYTAMMILIWRPKEDNRVVYEAVRETIVS